jgi:glycosyltransferase involved in cell wall biosynthesis
MTDRPTLHLLGIPHTLTRAEFSHDAFTNKVRVFAPMLRGQGYRVVHYGWGGAESGADEDVAVAPELQYWALLRDAGIVADPHAPNWYWHQLAKIDTPWYREWNARVGAALRQRVNPDRDIVCCTFGRGQAGALESLPSHTTVVESGIGYPGSYLRFRVFESYAWMHNTLGREGSDQGNDYHWVVPNGFDLGEWSGEDPHTQEYVLFVGRLSSTKGLDIFVEMARHRPDLSFVFVGQGDPAPYLQLGLPNLHYRCPVTGRERFDLYARALTTVCLSRYIEPFGQVHIESLLCGTPVITSDFGVYPETVRNGVNGYRCHTLGDVLRALDLVPRLSRSELRAHTQARYDLRVVGRQYDAVFQQVADLRGDGWYSLRSALTIQPEVGPCSALMR